MKHWHRRMKADAGRRARWPRRRWAGRPGTRAIVPPMHVSTTFIRDPDNSTHRLHLRPAGQRDGAPDRGRDRGAGRRPARWSSAPAWRRQQPSARRCRRATTCSRRRSCTGRCATGSRTKRRRCGLTVDSRRHDRPRRRARRGRSRRDQADLDRDAGQSALDDHRHRGVGGDRAHGRRRARGRFDTCATPVLTQPLDARRRHRHACGDQISQRSLRRGRRRAGDRARQDALWARIGAYAQPCSARSSGRFEAWLLHARHADAATCACERPAPPRMSSPTRFASPPMIAEVLYPGPAAHPGHAVAARQMQGGFGGMLSIRVTRAASAPRSPRRRASSCGSARPRSAASRA